MPHKIYEIKEWLWYYGNILYNAVPVELYDGLLFIFCIVSVVLVVYYGIVRGKEKIAFLLLVEYVLLIYCSTVLYRPVLNNRIYHFTPFWSYRAILYEGNNLLIADNILNIAVFLPVGIFLCIAYNRIKIWVVIVVGMFVSVSIEALQFIFKNGVSESDDVMHNTIGCIVGWGGCKLIRVFLEKQN